MGLKEFLSGTWDDVALGIRLRREREMNEEEEVMAQRRIFENVLGQIGRLNAPVNSADKEVLDIMDRISEEVEPYAKKREAMDVLRTKFSQ